MSGFMINSEPGLFTSRDCRRCEKWFVKLYLYTANAPQQSRSARPEGKKCRYIKINLLMIVSMLKRIDNFYE
jgi:hypothetical protein